MKAKYILGAIVVMATLSLSFAFTSKKSNTSESTSVSKTSQESTGTPGGFASEDY